MIPRRWTRLLFLAFFLLVVIALYSMLQSVNTSRNGSRQVRIPTDLKQFANVRRIENRWTENWRTSWSSARIHQRSGWIRERPRTETERSADTTAAVASSGTRNSDSRSETNGKESESEHRQSLSLAKYLSGEHDVRGQWSFFSEGLIVPSTAWTDPPIVRYATLRWSERWRMEARFWFNLRAIAVDSRQQTKGHSHASFSLWSR